MPASIVSQRPNSGVPPQTLSIAKVFATSENQINASSTSVFIQAPLQVQAHRHPAPSEYLSPIVASLFVAKRIRCQFVTSKTFRFSIFYVLLTGALSMSGSQGASGPLSYQTVTSSVPSTTGPPYQLANPEGNSYFYDNSAPPAGPFQRGFINQQSNAFVAQSQPQQVARTAATVGNQQFQGNTLFGKCCL